MSLSIRTRLGSIFLGFLILVAGAVVATFLAVERQAVDTLTISMANQQRVLAHNIARALLGLRTDIHQGEYYLVLIELDQAVEQFDNLQKALLNGGEIKYGNQGQIVEIQATDSSEAREQLETIQALWEPVKISAEKLISGAEGVESSRAISEISFKTPLILTQISILAQLFENDAAYNLATLKGIQIVFFLSAVGLLAGGYLSVQRTILLPLQTLDAAAGQIASGDLSGAISIARRDEIGALAHSFETMRQEVAESRRISEAWTMQLENRVQHRTQELAALLEISADISSKLNVERVLGTVVNKGRELLKGEVAVLCLKNEAENTLAVASYSGPDAAITQDRVEITQGLPSDVVNQKQTVFCDACDTCPILSPKFSKKIIAAPLHAGNNTFGALCVTYLEHERPGDDAARLLTLLANTASISLENARLYGRAEMAAALAERERIAAEMHDGLAQTLGYLNLQVDQALNSITMDNLETTKAHLQMMHPAIQTAYSTVRQALVGLSDNGFAQHGFKAQLEACLDEFRQKSEVDVKLRLDETSLPDIPKNTQIQLLRIVQEGLTNIRRHAAATRATVTFTAENEQLITSIADNGCGFDPMTISNDGQVHLGLKIMRGRAERVGGNLIVQSQPGRGAKLVVSVPL